MVTRENLDAVVADREGIIRHSIQRNCGIGEMDPYTRETLEALIACVFYEPGWNTQIAESINRKPDFFVLTFDPEA